MIAFSEVVKVGSIAFLIGVVLINAGAALINNWRRS